MRFSIVAFCAVGMLVSANASLGQSNSQQKPQYIGEALMAADGTISVDLFMTGDGTPLHGHFIYKTTDRDYEMIIRHLGGIKPGETKPVPPFPN
jgi:hypothetical protein